MHRMSGAAVAALLIGLTSADFAATPAQLPAENPVVLENQQPGTSGWIFSKPGDDVNGQIKGYPSATSVLQNQNITFHVSVNPAQTYTIDFYRIGWYGGTGGRHRLRVGPLDGVQQRACEPEATTGVIACNWTPSYTLTVPADWTSGIYAALLTNAQGFQNYVIFVVRDGRPAPFLYQQSIATDQAYNNYPNDGRTGKSLYAFSSFGANTVAGNPGAVKVSFDRPMADSGLGLLMNWEINLVRWLERSGYDVTYATSIETHANGAALRNHRAFLSSGHDEYWSKEMFDAVETARDSGVNLAFFGANNVFTQVRFEPSASGAANRVMVCYRSMPWNPIDPIQGPTTTTEFRNTPVNRPEQPLIGIQTALILPNSDYIVSNSSHWVYQGTGFKDGDAVPGIVGYEADSYVPNYPAPVSNNHTLLSRSPYTDPRTGIGYFANSSIYQAPSGAWVFAAGTMSWSWALDDVPGPASHFRVDSRIQRATANILNAFLTGAPANNNPSITGFTPSAAREGAAISIAGTNFTGATAVRFNGISATFAVTSDTTIDVTVPAGAPSGPVTVTTPNGIATSRNDFIVVRPPTVSSFMPTSARPGSLVSIVGASFTGTTGIKFNGVPALFAIVSDSAVQTIVPNGASTGPVTVTTTEGTGASPTSFVVLGLPSITGFTPASGPAGTSVTINGTSLTGASAVRFNGTAAVFTLVSDTTIQATVPAGATSGPVSVTTPEGTATSAASFTPIDSPAIDSFTPASGPVGANVTVTGTSFAGATAVRFNGTAAAFTVTSPTAIQATVPAGATTGAVSVTTPGGTATSAASFTVINPPAIASFAPAAGPVGTNVTVTGAAFTGATSVRFNGTTAAFTVISATTIQTTVPAGATSGAVSVTTSAGTATSAASFTVLFPPSITSFAPVSGLAGATVTINGTNLARTTAVTFNGTAASFTVTSATTIQATVPEGATTGPLRVTSSGGTATSAANFTVMVMLTVTKTGVLGGTVTSSPPGIDCGNSCSAAYATDSVVTLTAKPVLLSLFSGWSGCDSVSGTTCTVTMRRARAVVARFLP